MTEDQIINIFGNGQVYDAIFLAKSNGFLTLAANFEKAIKHIEDTKEYSKHYMKNNGRVAGAQVMGVGGPDFRQMKAMSHIQELGAKTLLDIGCADGSFCIFCLKNKLVENVIGIDPWIEGILWADEYFKKQNLNGTFINAVLEDVNLDDYQFDVVHLGEILEHVIDPVEVLKKPRKYDLKGIVITVPTERPPVTVDEKILLTDGRVAEHVRLISIEHLQDYCERSGFYISKSDTQGFGWVNLIATIK